MGAAVTYLSGLARETCLSVSRRDIIRDRRCPARKWALGQLDSSWSPRRRASSSSRSLRSVRMDIEGGAEDRWTGGRKGRVEEENRRWRRLRESPYSCHPEFLDGRMTSLSSYGFVFGSADSIGTSEGSLRLSRSHVVRRKTSGRWTSVMLMRFLISAI